ncbi:aminotransferase [Methylobacterium haplocladii]|uniref:8-amino-7-oxononanoate synthase n=1 Tax=Methylobacterium haplocladii TaxID=1176176 RepID=A0A512IQ86_9HYPH|nr:aminotransferase [Methylobacterium haplocladii]GEO99832.1 aminotransferase [Methylobacterium haplocladii]GJD84808.1 Methionine aminotransferase [Methylobacterium haplocladii]GLS57996.1 aminotransferase [Methylobacterium haplocladii]
MNPVFSDLPVTVFETMSRLAREHCAINLGQGFPDDPGPEDVREVAATALRDGYNQYPPMMGLPSLRVAIAAHYGRHQGLDLDPETEVMVTSGATEALAGAIFALVAPGDEVVLFEPMYDAYLPLVRRAGGVPRFVTLKPPHFRIDEDALAAAFSEKTRLVILNNPLNPSATVFAEADLSLLAGFCRRFDAVALCDEVWEHVIFDGARHRPLMALPGMRERTIKIGSAGKIFSLTGWKVGFVMAAPHLMRALARAHQFLTFTTPPNLQEAAAYGLAKDEAYFTGMRAGLARSRDRLAAGLADLGFTVLPSAATYFLSLDIGEADDVAFCETLVREHGVAAIPVSAFYETGGVRNLVRFCFAKTDATLDAALDRLAGYARAA